MDTIEQLINKGPATVEEVAAGKLAVEGSSEHVSAAESSTKNVLEAFKSESEGHTNETQGILNKDKSKEEPKKTDDNKDKQEEVSKGNEEVRKPVQEAENKVVEGQQTPPPTARKPVVDSEELKGLIPESALPLFKKMDNSAKQYVVAELKRKNKELEEIKNKLTVAETSQKQANWYEHEEGYTLIPEYKQLTSSKNQISNITDHYRKQLIAIKEGEDWFDLVQNKDGSISQVKQKASPQADAMITERIGEALSVARALENKEIELKQSFKSNVINHRSGMTKLEDEYFPQYTDATELSKNPDFQSISKTIEQFGLQNDRMSGMLKKLYVYAMTVTRQAQEMEGKLTKIPIKNNNGPTGDEINNGTTGNNKEIPLEERKVDTRAFRDYLN